MTSKVAVLGAGAWGTALAKLLAEKEGEVADVALWSRRRELCDAVNAAGENARYLPGAALPKNLVCTDDLGAAIAGADMIVFVVPSHGTRDVARAAAPYVRQTPGGPRVPIVSATKGIENDSLMFMDEVLAEELPPHARDDLAFLSGPSFAKELASRLPTAVVIAARDPEVRAHVMRRFHTPYLRTYASDDIPGVECGARVRFRGQVGMRSGGPVMINPAYELVAPGAPGQAGRRSVGEGDPAQGDSPRRRGPRRRKDR